MRIQQMDIPEVRVLIPEKYDDGRGFFSEVYSARTLARSGIDADFVQDNHSFSARRGTMRGLHFQVQPHAQAKLVRVTRGSAFDVAVDLRRTSPTYGRHVSVVLSAEAWNQVLVPIGFAHGFMTLEPNTEVVYKVTGHYSPDHERGLRWNDPRLAIRWPVPEGEVVLSDRDRQLPGFEAFVTPFG